MNKNIIIGIDAGTSWIKAVAFDFSGNLIDSTAIRNVYHISPQGAAEQSMWQTWYDCVETLCLLNKKIDNLPHRLAALSVTAQGDGTWLLDKNNQPIIDAWIWLDARAATTANRIRKTAGDLLRYNHTGTGINCCQMGAQLAHMQKNNPNIVQNAAVAFHCKDWLYYNFTGVVATDPSEAIFTFGDFRTRTYSDEVIESLGLARCKSLLTDIIDGVETHHHLCPKAAAATGLLVGTPVILGYVDIVCTALGAGVYSDQQTVGCSILGTTGVHIKAVSVDHIQLNAERSGYVMAFPIAHTVAHLQTNMAATLNIDWILQLANDLLNQFNNKIDYENLVEKIDQWLSQSQPGGILFHPYISQAGERGPFINATARANFAGLNTQHGFSQLVRAVIEGLGLAARDCYSVLGAMPTEIRLSGGAAKSPAVREIISACLGVPLRYSIRNEAGAAGAAMIAAVSIGAYTDIKACIEKWVTPFLQDCQPPNPDLSAIYEPLFTTYKNMRKNMPNIWQQLNEIDKMGRKLNYE